MPVATDAGPDDSSSTDGLADPNDESSDSSESEDGLAEPEMEATVRRSARIQENARIQQQADAPRPGRFVIVPPTLTDEQRREYVRYEEDDEGNLI